MKLIYSILFLSILFIGCQPAVDNSANEAFEKNSATVMSLLEGFQSENIDYDAIYSDSLVVQATGVGETKESYSLDEMKENNKGTWAFLDFKLLTDPVSLLPGVNADTKMADGSVRYYGDWQVTRTATDSTEAKSGVIRIYASYDFNADGKITNQQTYGDFTGIRNHVNSKDEAKAEATEE